jgi:hypothetical protein
MTGQQFLDYFYIQMDKVATNSLGSFEPDEIAILANEALEALVRERISPKNNRKQEGLEQGTKRVEDLAEIIKYSTISNITNSTIFPNAVNVQLPNTLLTNNSTDFSDVHWFTIYENAIINLDDCDRLTSDPLLYQRVQVVEKAHQDINFLLSDPFNKPNTKRIIRVRSEGRNVTLLHGKNYNIITYIIGYIRKPRPIDFTDVNLSVSELSDHMHMELVNKTVEMALKRIESPRLSTEIQTNLE